MVTYMITKIYKIFLKKHWMFNTILCLLTIREPISFILSIWILSNIFYNNINYMWFIVLFLFPIVHTIFSKSKLEAIIVDYVEDSKEQNKYIRTILIMDFFIFLFISFVSFCIYSIILWYYWKKLIINQGCNIYSKF